jgi:hypothetical protein
MITSLLNWWTEQMRDLVPASLRLSGQTWRRALIVIADPSDAAIAELFLLGGGGTMLLKDFPTANVDSAFFHFAQ